VNRAYEVDSLAARQTTATVNSTNYYTSLRPRVTQTNRGAAETANGHSCLSIVPFNDEVLLINFLARPSTIAV
jgi:hypothetical protein